MQNERMKVLQMLEDGVVTADEATKLLEALQSTGETRSQFQDFAHDMKRFAKEVTCKINELAKKAEPKVKEFTKTVVAKTADIADNISQSLNEKVRKMENCCETEADNDCCCCCGSETEAAENGNGPCPCPTEQEKSEE